jgi:hypothetical protein
MAWQRVMLISVPRTALLKETSTIGYDGPMHMTFVLNKRITAKLFRWAGNARRISDLAGDHPRSQDAVLTRNTKIERAEHA